jgi:hypothetical protein
MPMSEVESSLPFLGRHVDMPMSEVESSLPFLGRHLSPGDGG